jgi:hypothetical protein
MSSSVSSTHSIQSLPSLSDEHAHEAKRNHFVYRVFTLAYCLLAFVIVSVIVWQFEPLYIGAGIGVIFLLSLYGLVRFLTVKSIIRTLPAGDLSQLSRARAESMIEWLSPVIGVEPPELLVVDSDIQEVLVFGISRHHACLAVTTKAVEEFDLMELEAVIAQGLVRIRQANYLLASALTFLLKPLIKISPTFISGLSKISLVTPVEEVDLRAVRTTRYPPALARAYSQMVESTRAGTQWMETLSLLCAIPHLHSSAEIAGVPANIRIQMLEEL